MSGTDATSLHIVDVDQISAYIQEMFRRDPLLDDLWVRGEVSNARRSANGHWYFTLKSANAQLRCALFKNSVPLIQHHPSDGDAVIVNGRIGAYPNFGTYQLYVDQIVAEGAGLLQLQLEELRLKLEQEGLFDSSRKRPLPEYPKTIAVITSPTGSVWHDIQDVLKRRYPLGELLLSPAIVQGDLAPASVIKALERITEDGRADVVIIARGGGSIEDLWAFNDERVVRAIFRSPIPIVSAIGHETDVTLCDLVADQRAPTPSAAAELVAPHIREYVQHLRSRAEWLTTLASRRMTTERAEIQGLHQRIARFDPKWTLQQERLRIDRFADLLHRQLSDTLRNERTRLEHQAQKLHLLDPRTLLARGYALVTDGENGNRVTGASALSTGQSLRLDFHDGTADVQVTTSTPRPKPPRTERES
jgi:exodeoxyribonuclease VII large subunit